MFKLVVSTYMCQFGGCCDQAEVGLAILWNLSLRGVSQGSFQCLHENLGVGVQMWNMQDQLWALQLTSNSSGA